MQNHTQKQVIFAIAIPVVVIAFANLISTTASLVPTAVITLLIHWIIGIPSIHQKTEKPYDITGTIAVWSMLLYTVQIPAYLSNRALLLVLCCGIWTTRLGIFLLIRIQKHKHDQRFNALKTKPLSFFNAWQLSAAWTFMTPMCALCAIISNTQVHLSTTDGILASLWLLAFLIETIADIQKLQFKSRKNPTPFIQTGLWRYSQHPNYFGEIMMWFMVACLAYPNLTSTAYFSLCSPLLVTALLTKISGINLLQAANQEKFGHLKSYQDYIASTPKLIPNPFKR